MLLSVAHMSIPSVPTDLQLKLKPYFIGMLVLQLFLTIGRFWIKDHFGAILMFLVSSIGVLVVCSECAIDSLYCIYYGIMAFVSGFMDVILIVERGSRSHWHLLSMSAPYMHNLASIIFIMCALSQLVSSFMAYKLYKSAEEAEAQQLLPTQQQAAIYNAAMHQAVDRPAEAQDGPTPFSGQCHRLG